MKRKLLALLMAVMIISTMMPSVSMADGACNHNQYTKVTDATCTEDGMQRAYCSYCGILLWEEMVSPKLGHDWGDWSGPAAVSCTEDSVYTRVCSRCGEKESRTDKAPGHSWGNWELNLEGSCTIGNEYARTCSACGEKETKNDEAPGHKWGNWELTLEGSCAIGNEYTRTCSVCGEKDTKNDEATGHKWGNWTQSKNPTCTDPGEKTRVCSNCGDSETVYTPRLGHDTKGWTVTREPGDFSTGLRSGYCASCGKHIDEEFYPEGTLRKGDFGNDVKALQNSLNAAGFYCGTPDGSFGPNTVSAVKSAEKSFGLSQDGIAWPGVIAMLAGEIPANLTNDDDNKGEAEEAPSLLLKAAIVSTKKEYKAGDTIEFSVTLENVGKTDLTNVAIVFDPGFGEIVIVADAGAKTFVPGQKVKGTWKYTITKQDYWYWTTAMSVGELYCNMQGKGVTPEGKKVTSNTVYMIAELVERRLDKIIDDGLELKVTMQDSDMVYNVGDTMTFDWTLTNVSKMTLKDWYVMFASRDEQHELVGGLEDKALDPGATVSGTWTYTLTNIDKQWAELLESPESISMLFLGGATGPKEECVQSNNVLLEGKLGESDRQDLVSVRKQVTSMPANGSSYTVGETITYEISVTHLDVIAESIYDLSVVDPLKGSNEEACVQEFAELKPGETVTCSFDYVVTQDDADFGEIANIASALWNQGDELEPVEVYSNEVITYTASAAEEKTGEAKAEVLKQITSSPANGTFYTEGENITYEITVTNTGDRILYNIYVYDAMLGDPAGESAELADGESYTCEGSITVSEEQAAMGYINNTATVTFDDGVNKYTEYSNTVKAVTGVEETETVSDGMITVIKCAADTAINGSWYAEGEEAEFEITVTNGTDAAIGPFDVVDPLGGESDIVDSVVSLEAGKSLTYTVKYVITKEDAEWGSFENQAYIQGVDLLVYSNVVTIATAGEEETIDLSDVVIQKSLESTPANGSYFVEDEIVEFSIKVTNGSKIDLSDIKVYDDILGEGTLVGEPGTLLAGQGETYSVFYIVTKDDCEKGFVTNQAYMTVGGEKISSNYVVADADVGECIDFDKAVVSTPANGSYYIEGETVDFELTVTNNLGKDLANVKVYDDLLGAGEAAYVGECSILGDGESQSFTVPYVVSQADAEATGIMNQARLVITSGDETEEILSNMVFVETGVSEPGDMPVEDESADHFWITKTVTSKPANGTCYAVGEEITYMVILTNVTDRKYTDIRGYDILSDEPGHLCYTQETLGAEQIHMEFKYTVTQDDVDFGTVVNVAWFKMINPEGEEIMGSSDYVIVLAGQGGSTPVVPEKVVTPALEGGSCARTITAETDGICSYDARFCDAHIKLGKKTEELIAKGVTAEQVERLYELWTEQIDALYSEWVKSDPANKEIIASSRDAFYQAVSAYYVRTGDGDAMLRMMENRCIDLCWKLHNAFAARPDSMDSNSSAAAVGVTTVCSAVTVMNEDSVVSTVESLCEEHADIMAVIESIVMSTSTPEEQQGAWLRSYRLLRTELDKVYTARMNNASDAEKALLESEKAAFDTMLNAELKALTILYANNLADGYELLAKTVEQRLMLICPELVMR